MERVVVHCHCKEQCDAVLKELSEIKDMKKNEADILKQICADIKELKRSKSEDTSTCSKVSNLSIYSYLYLA